MYLSPKNELRKNIIEIIELFSKVWISWSPHLIMIQHFSHIRIIRKSSSTLSLSLSGHVTEAREQVPSIVQILK